jgi:hypothetical protein
MSERWAVWICPLGDWLRDEQGAITVVATYPTGIWPPQIAVRIDTLPCDPRIAELERKAGLFDWGMKFVNDFMDTIEKFEINEAEENRTDQFIRAWQAMRQRAIDAESENANLRADLQQQLEFSRGTAKSLEAKQKIEDAARLYIEHGNWTGTIQSDADYTALCKLLGVEPC